MPAFPRSQDLAHCSLARALTNGDVNSAHSGGHRRRLGRECGWTSAAEETRLQAHVPPGQPASQERPELGRQRGDETTEEEEGCAFWNLPPGSADGTHVHTTGEERAAAPVTEMS